MRAMILPSEDPKQVYQACVESVSDTGLRARLNALTNNIGIAADDYHQKALVKQLYTIPPNSCDNDVIALGDVTKKELKSVYNTHMVGKAKPARKIYDLLLSRAPLGRCPFCGMGLASTLDHYLPKSKYPQLSVVPSNLVPSCKDCNTAKSNDVPATAEEQSLHPYYDHNDFVDEQWLYAEVKQTVPATMQFFVRAPDHWDEISKKRVQSHFIDFNLAARFSVEASNQLACLKEVLLCYEQKLGFEGVKQHITCEATANSLLHRNSWQTAMFQALASSDWYCSVGFCG